jgi:hypothetical protein
VTARCAALLELSSERDQWLRRLLAAEREGYDRGRADGFDEGWIAAEDYDEREHQAVAARVLETPEQSVARRLRAAEAGCRRDALDHWRKRWAELYRLSRDERLIREALTTEPLKRSYEQVMALVLRAARRSAA